MSTKIRTVRKAKRQRQSLQPIITRLQYELAPLHPLPEGPPHPAFPQTLLHYHLLTEVQLDSFAQYYHQWTRTPTIWTHGYPEIMDWNAEWLESVGHTTGPEARIRIKKRKFGRFIGLRGCETPVEEAEEKERWLRRREEMALKAGNLSYWGRRGFGQW